MAMTEKDIQEALVGLFLRLNGYLMSGFIVHAPQGDPAQSDITDVDILAVRFPYNFEPEREIMLCSYLETSDSLIDVIVGEVKSGGRPIQFNDNLRQPENLMKVLRWVGPIDETGVTSCADDLIPQMQPKVVNSPESFMEAYFPKSDDVPPSIRIRPIIFHLGYPSPRKNQAKFIGHEVIMSFIWDCLRPEQPRSECQTIYDFGHWGPLYQPLVLYFKNENRHEHGTPEDLTKFLLES